ncbi:hypothetical protein [Niallia endozanthoxylica]|uniref:Uncharacterized protein n=1 Tax=Niallia endozanthoxylica TaxID=2036016 RepID=A0A5J5HRW4_9BACI|nr:hypothetical protein [Niallia endozanthoxylica]KAA9023572.1 hypothetical protein F4V44_12970 [Niallia endozanthoxylica]
MVAKLLIVLIFTLSSIILTNVIVVSLFYGINWAVGIVPNNLTGLELMQHSMKLASQAISAAGISLIPLYFGMLKKSVAITIVSSIIMVSFMSPPTDFSVLSVIIIPLVLSVVGFTIGLFCFKNIEKVDLV